MDMKNGAEAPIVGIGASAGGLEALSLFFRAMPPKSGLVFVVVVHLDPTHQSHLSALLAKQTAMPVVEIQDGISFQVNHVYVIAPDRHLIIDANRLRLVEPAQPRGHRHPVDVLFNSLAQQRRERAIAIVLSGSGTNGTQGLRHIRANGGLILIQDPSTAKFDGMPRSAILSGLVDFVAAPEQMPDKILAYLQHGYMTPVTLPAEPPLTERTQLNEILGLLRSYSAEGFRSYRAPHLLRRVTRRMSVLDVPNLEQYFAILQHDQMEVKALANDILISVTGFFRDEDAWEALEKLVVAPLLASKQINETIRIWVPACSTGEEAYSIAMLIIDRAERSGKQITLKVFASDLMESNLAIARAGRYVNANVESLQPARIKRFFENSDGYYRVKADLRACIVFAKQDILCDPPFSNIDLISCRNLLIYLESAAQKRLLSLFHFALRGASYLFLGSAETVGQSSDWFEVLSKKWRIYRRSLRNDRDVTNLSFISESNSYALLPSSSAGFEESTPFMEIACRILLVGYAPAALLIDQQGRVLFFTGITREFLERANAPTPALLTMTHSGMLTKLRKALSEAISERRSVELSIGAGGSQTENVVKVAITPISRSPLHSDLYLITFKPRESQSHKYDDPVSDEIYSPSLLHELAIIRSELQSTIVKFQRAAEELKVLHEEATSMNEELQSINEELESSKEELQSFNEELHSVNTELQQKIVELEEATGDLFNLFSSTEIATILLNEELRIKWFSPGIDMVFDLEGTDIGRPIRSFAQKFSDENLLVDAELVLQGVATIEVEIARPNEKWLLRRTLPYRVKDNCIVGVVVTFIDITERKRAEKAESYRTLNHELELRVTERTVELENANLILQSEIAARRDTEDQMEVLAHFDQLTEIPNRLQLQTILPKVLEEIRVTNSEMALLYLDLDRFKPVNDMYGHAAGDRVLQVVGRRLKSVIRHSDMVGRLGGDEFIVGICDADARAAALSLAVRIIESLRHSIEIGGTEVQIGVSIGIAVAPADSSELEQLLQDADMALYRAKRAGGNTWRFFTEKMGQERVQRMYLEADIRNALLSEEFSLHYQAIIDTKTERVMGFEALLRWNHPSRGLLLPGTFIGIAEESGLIVQIGSWVLTKACSDAMEWPEELSVAVNLSGIQVRDPGIQATVQDALTRTGLAPGRLELEITESVLLEQNAENLLVINNLRELGVLIAMDDFGTGYSSLNHLLKFPYRKMKLDLSFIRHIEDDNNALDVVRAVLALGAALQMTVTAEGVETAGQLSILKRIGCPQVQGFFLGRPIQVSDIPAFLSAGR